MAKRCELERVCHPWARGLTGFGTKFSRKVVTGLAASSVLLIDKKEGVNARVASGTLIWHNVVLCSSHSIQASTITNYEILFLFTCNEMTAPFYYSDSWPTCATFADAPQATLIRELEQGAKHGLDYTLLAIKWTSDPPQGIDIARPGQHLSEELLLIGHPHSQSKQAGALAQPTQASAGQLLAKQGPHPDPGAEKARADSKEYSYAAFASWYGMSGGGVFNEQAEIVGVLTGISKEKQIGFLNLWSAAERMLPSDNGPKPACPRIRQWMGGGPPLFPGDLWVSGEADLSS